MNIDSTLLKDSITEDKMIDILTQMGASYVKDSREKDEIVFDTICHNHSGSGSPKLYYSPERKMFHCFTGCSHSFDIYELVSKVYKLRKVDMHFSSIVEFVATQTGYQPQMGFGEAFSVPIEKETTGDLEWLNKVTSRKKRKMPELKTYGEGILDVFSVWHHNMLLDDHISIEALKTFKIGFHEPSNRLVFNYRRWTDGKLIGLRGRTTVDDPNKYMPLTVQGKTYAFPSMVTLYGLYENKPNISKARKCFLFEAEKSVLQCESYYGRDGNLGLAMMGKNLSDLQVQILFDIGVEEVILCYDKMYEKYDRESKDWKEYESIVMKSAKKLAPYFRTYVACDRKGLLDRDMSPSDAGQKILEENLRDKLEVFTRSD